MKPKTKRLAAALGIFALIVVAGAALLYVAYPTFLKSAYPMRYQEIVERYAAEYDVPPSLVYAVIHTESHFDEQAVSHAGAKGLMQLMDSTYEWIQTKFPDEPKPLECIFEADINIRCGTKLLQVLGDMFSETETMLAAYNAGNGTVKKWLADPRYSKDGKTLDVIPISETATYVQRVLNAQKRYQMLYGIE